MLKLKKLASSLLIAFTPGAIGSLATIPNIPLWYASLNKPFFNPPNWVFGPVWTILYLLMGVSLYLIWTARYKGSKKTAFIVFGAQLLLNALWSLVFFGLLMKVASVVIIIVLLGLILLMIKLFWPISRMAAWLLVPYAIWVSFATVLTIAIAGLN